MPALTATSALVGAVVLLGVWSGSGGVDDANAPSTPRSTGSGSAATGSSLGRGPTTPLLPKQGDTSFPLILGFTRNRRTGGSHGKEMLLGPQADDVAALTSNNKG